MTKAIPLSRPAMSAIAAFLALSASNAFAQAAPPPAPADVPAMVSPVAPPPAAPEPKSPAPVAAPQAAQAPAPKPVIRVPLDLPTEPAAPVAKTAERPAATTKAAPARTERSATRARDAGPATAAPQHAAPAAALATSEAVPVPAPTEPAAALSPLPANEAPAQAVTTGDAFPWEVAGGAAALLLVGGAGFAFARRRRTGRAVDSAAMSFEEMAAAEAVPYNPPREEAAAPRPAIRSTPSFAAAPHGSMGRHEAMALAGPTDDNPFETLKKRLQRAHFLDRQERAQYEAALAGQKDMERKPLGAWEIAQRDIPAPAEQEVRRPERGSTRPGDLRPGLIRH